MVSNYRKSPGRFGEIGNEVGIERPPARPSIAFPNARNVLHQLDVLGGKESATPSIGKSDSTPTTALYFSTTDVDDMSSLGEDPSILEIRFPAMQVTGDDYVQPAVTNSQTTSQTMTTLMDLFHPTESAPRQKLHSKTPNSEPPPEEAKKKKKKKKRSDDDDKKTKVGSDKNKGKGEKSKTKKSKSKEDAKNTTKNESLDRKKKKVSPSEPLIVSVTPNEHKKAKKKHRKSDESSPEVKLTVDKTSEKKQKKPSKGGAVVPAPTCQESISKGSKASKGKGTNRAKSSSQNDNSPKFSRATKEMIGKNKTYDFKSKPPSMNTESKNLLRDTILVPGDQTAGDCSLDDQGYYSCARSTLTYDCFDLPDSTKHSTCNCPTTTTNISPTTGKQHRTLEFAIASIPKERATEGNPKLAKKSKGPFIKRIFGENHSRQLAAF